MGLGPGGAGQRGDLLAERHGGGQAVVDDVMRRGGTVHLIWVRSDAATLRRRLTARGLIRDTAKLAEFERFSASMRLGTEPAAPHYVVDNRLTAAVPLGEQVAALVGTRRA